MADSDDDMPQLSAHTLAALQEFYTDQKNLAVKEMDTSEMPQEDWQLSQFWYDEETATALAQEALSVAGERGRIACISCPTLYKRLREVKPDTVDAKILEYDNRFSKFGDDFIFYDYNNPVALDENLHHAFDVVVADPPFLAEECLTKTSETIKYLAKDKIILCTGAVMADLAQKLLGVTMCQFKPHHANNLANEFRCYANYTTEHLSKENS